MISGFRRDINEIWALLGCYAVARDWLAPEDGNNMLSRNVGMELPLYAT